MGIFEPLLGVASADTTLLPAGRDTRLVGTAGISIDPAEREFFGPFQISPPDSSVYLSNMVRPCQHHAPDMFCNA